LQRQSAPIHVAKNVPWAFPVDAANQHCLGAAYPTRRFPMIRLSQFVVPIALLVLACTGQHVCAENLQGHAKGFTTRNISLTQNGAPLLQSFYFRFTNDDHHFAAIEVVPGIPAINQASIGYSDKNSDDRYFYNITFAPYFGTIFRRSDGREHCIGSCTYPLQAPPDRANHVFVLRGFYIHYVGGDRHIDQIKIEENNGQVTVALNDKNDDDRFRVDLHYAYIPRSQFLVPDGEAAGTSRGGHRMAIPGGSAVIRGFNFDFRSQDHHIKDIGVMLNGAGRMEVFYGDKNQDDSFDWKVQYAILRP
jgi:hypothetical protein